MHNTQQHAPQAGDRHFTIMLVMGLPGSGKTSLCQSLTSSNELYSHLAFDSVIPDSVVRDSQAGLDSPSWKEHRSCLLRALDQVLFDQVRKCVRTEKYFNDSSDISPALIGDMATALRKCLANQRPGSNGALLLDDNFYYSSMRHAVFQLARFYECGFCQLYIKINIAQLKMVNALRDCPVPQEVIERMADKLEPPDVNNNWEKFSSVLTNAEMGFLDSAGCYTTDSTNCKVHKLLDASSANPFVPDDPEEARRQAAEARELCSLSLLHQADLRLRAVVSDWLSARSDASNKGELGQLAAERKRTMMSSLRDGQLKVPAQLNSYRPEMREQLDSFLVANISLPE